MKTKRSYWYIGTSRSLSSTPLNPLSSDTAGGIKANSPLEALDLAYNIVQVFGPVTALVIYDLLPGGEIGPVVARVQPSYDKETNTHIILRSKGDDDKRTTISLPPPKETDQPEQAEQPPKGYNVGLYRDATVPAAVPVYPLYGDIKP